MSNANKLRIETGTDSRSVAAYVAAIAQSRQPALAWAEPEADYARDGNAGRIAGFLPLVAGMPTWAEDVPLIEARLFWATEALHVIAAADGCRWSRVAESDVGEELSRSEIPVHTLRDAARFGLDTGHWPTGRIVAVEYRRNGRLVAWRLHYQEESHAK